MSGVSEDMIAEITDGFARLVENCLTRLPTKLTSRRSTRTAINPATPEDPIYLDEVDSSMFSVQVQLGAIAGGKYQRQARNAEFSTKLVAEIRRQLEPLRLNVTYGALTTSPDDSLINISIRCTNQAETKALYARLNVLGHVIRAKLNESLLVTSFHATTAADGSRVIRQTQAGEISILEDNPDVSRVLDALNHSALEQSMRSPAPALSSQHRIPDKKSCWPSWCCCFSKPKEREPSTPSAKGGKYRLLCSPRE